MTSDDRRQMTRRRFAAVLLAGALGGHLTWTTAAQAAGNPAEDYVSGIAKQVMSLANSGATGMALRSKFAALLNRYINLRAIANYALGTYRSKLPAAKADMFYTLVNNYSAALFVYYVDDFKGSTLDIMSNATQGKFIIIQSAIVKKSGGHGEQVRWRLLPDGGGFRVTDVNIKGIWLTISMRDRFTKVLKGSNGDFEALFAELRSAETW